MLGVISGVTSGYVDIKADRQIVRFALGDAFTGVFSGDGKTKRSLTDLTPGTNVRVAFVKPVLGEAYRKATEIDILRGPTKPLPLPKDSTP
jgi:hypothetical protein